MSLGKSPEVHVGRNGKLFWLMRLKCPRPYRDAIRLYSEAIMWATPASEDLSMAFANRSAAHFDNGNFRASIQDIENAFSLGSYPEKLHYKLHLRRGFSLKELGQEKLALAAFSTAEALLEVAQLDAAKVDEVKDALRPPETRVDPWPRKLKLAGGAACFA